MNIRSARVAGMFYPGNKPELQSMVNDLLKLNQPEKQYDKIFGIISPHAGYPYSGHTAAKAYNTLIGKSYSTVIVISPSHSEYFNGISVFNGDGYSTPLGNIEINKELANSIVAKSDSIFFGSEGHGREHALEVQLPFLQTVLKEFQLLPIVMGDQSEKLIKELANVLGEVYNEDTLIVASTDLSHFYSKEIANKLDSRIEAHIKNFDFFSLMNDLKENKCEACGGGPMSSLMMAAQSLGYTFSSVLERTDSSRTTGDDNEVVGYLSAVIYNA